MIRVTLPFHLRNLARVGKEVHLELDGPITQQAILDKVEELYPVLRGTVRDHSTHKRRDFIRFFAAGQDWSHEAPDKPLPESIANGSEPFRIIGAMAGG
ncbi:MAG: MoaD/ThiS family protein [Ardenticatenaceae bacterium]|nr:MoaD/ThiS family protein [Anaerolineales bacterium]MCB8939817.1 MoaD/ThiS family protein [Ardenticatenaceae bacterium]MCB8975100.1 MoaD/ThiS family protein [Ardenticatenaceae bacterium]